MNKPLPQVPTNKYLENYDRIFSGFTPVFVGGFGTVADVVEGFQLTPEQIQGVRILYAEYDVGSYDGSATVVFERDDQLYTVDESHCSCYGLETWDPQPTSVEALTLRSQHADPAFKKFVEQLAAS